MEYSTEFDALIEDVDPFPENYGRFIELMRVNATSRKHIPSGCREQYIPGLSEGSQSLYEAYKKQYSSNPFGNTTIEGGTRLVDRMTEENKKGWEEVITSTDPTHNSYTTSTPPCLVNSNQFAQLLINGRSIMSCQLKRPVLPTETTGEATLVYPFSDEGYGKGIAALKNGKAYGIDDVLLEQQNNLDSTSHKWLLDMLNKFFLENKVLRLWRQSKIIAILKPGKDSTIESTDKYQYYFTRINSMKD